MFGLFKKKDYREETKHDFESMVQKIRAVEPMKQAMVGRGITMAENSFNKQYTKASFQAAPFPERQSFIDHIKKMEVAIHKQEGPIAICSIGYGLFNRWLAAAAMSDAELLQQFEVELTHFKKLADSFGGEQSGAL